MANGADGSIIIDTELDNTGFKRGSQELENAANRVTQAINRIGSDANRAVDTTAREFERAAESARNAAQSSNTYNNSTQAISYSEFGKGFTDAENKLKSINGQIEKMGTQEAVGIKTDNQMIRFQIEVDKAKSNIDELKEKVAGISAQKITNPEFEILAEQAKKAEAALFTLYNKRDENSELGISKYSDQAKRLEIQIRNAEEELERLERMMASMQERGTAYTLGANAPEISRILQRIKDAESQIGHFQEVASGFNTVSEPADSAETSLRSLDAELKRKPADAEGACGALSKLGNVLKACGFGALKAVGSLMKLPFNAIASGAKKVVSKLLSFSKAGRKGVLTSNGLVKSLTGLKRMLISRIKRTFISYIINSVKTAMKSMVSYSSVFNESISSMRNAMTGLSANISVTFANIVNAIAPAITAIINAISTAITYINAFFALLSGRSTMTVAKKQTDSYADSLKSAGGAASDLKNQVYGFDELNKEQSGGGGGGGAADLFEEVEIDSILPSDVSRFFTNLKTAFESGDWEGIGTIVSEGLNKINSKIYAWIIELRPKAVQWARNIAQILNGLVSGFDWSLLGATIGEGLSTAFDAINTFLTTFDWLGLGAKIAALFGGLFDSIDFALMGTMLANGFNTVWNALYGFVANFDWAGLGLKLATGAYSLVSKINWGAVALFFSVAIAGVFQAVISFIENIQWESVGSIIWNAAIDIITNIDWGGLISKIFELLGAAIGGATSLVMGFAKSIWEAIKSAWEGVKTHFKSYFDKYGGDIIAGLLNGIWNAIKGIGSWIYNNIFKPFIDGFKAAFGIASPSTVMEELGGYIIEGLLKGLMEAWAAITEWIAGVAADFIQFFENLWESIKTGAETAWTAINTSLETAWTGVSSAATTVWEGVKTTLSDAWTGIGATASTVWEGVSTTISGVWDTISATASTAWAGINTAATEAWNGITTTLSTTWTKISTGAKTTWDGISAAITTVWNTLSDTATTVWRDILSTISDVWDTLSTAAETTWGAISTTITSVWDGLKSAAKTVWDAISSTITGVWNTLSTTASTTWSAISATITGVWDTLSTKASEVWNGVTTTVTSAWNTVSTAASSTWDGVTNTITNAWDTVSTAATSTWSSVKSTVVGWFTSTHNDVKAIDWTDVGEGITNGTEGGITGLWSSFKSRVISKFQGLVDSVKSKLGIASPSKVFASIGDFMMQGLANGVEDNAGDAVRAVNNVAQAVQEEASMAAPELDLALGETENGLETVAGELSGIAKIFTGIADAIQRMGGLQVPEIAQGTVIPYKIRAAAQGAASVQDSTVGRLTSDFDETMSDQADLLKELIATVKKLNLVVDGDSLTSAITSRQRFAQQAFGGV